MPKFDFSDVDFNNVDPERLSIGSCLQDCYLIAQTYEKGAHATPTEAAIYSTLTRTIQNNKRLSDTLTTTLTSYVKNPQLSNSEYSVESNNNLQSLNIEDQYQSTYGDNNFGDKLLGKLKECIPCMDRMLAYLELHPNVDLLGIYEGFLKNQILTVGKIADVLNNYDQYGDICELINLLSFMCIPDLQRIISLLMALFTLNTPKFDGIIGLLSSLIAPIFSPLLMAMGSLFDQFSVIVLSPLKCVVDSIDTQLKKLHIKIKDNKGEVSTEFEIENSLTSLSNSIKEGMFEMENKMQMYIDQIKAMLGELGGNDTAYLELKLSSLKLIRLINFVRSIITAITQGQLSCVNKGQSPEQSELNNFMDTFLNPNSPFALWIDDDGQLHLDEKDNNLSTINDSIIEYEGTNLVNPTEDIKEVSLSFSNPIRVTFNTCRFKDVSNTETNKINQWMDWLKTQ